MLRKSVNENSRIASTWIPEGRCKRRRLKETWRRTIEREQGELGFKGWAEAGSCAKDREAWRERELKALFPSEGKGQDDDDDDDGCYNMNGLYILYNTKANSHGTGTLYTILGDRRQ